MKKCCILLLLSIQFCTVFAQTHKMEVLQQMITRSKSLKSVSYKLEFMDVNPFSVGDTLRGNRDANLIFNQNGKINHAFVETVVNQGQTRYSELYTKSMQYTFDLIDSTFTMKAGVPIENDFSVLIQSVEDRWFKEPKKIHRNADTIYNSIKCYSFIYKPFDTASAGNHDFIHYTLFIDQKSFLPVYFRHAGAGSVTKEGYSLGRLNFLQEKIFGSYRLNKVKEVALPNLEHFTTPNTKMLTVGNPAPVLRVRDLKGNAIDTAQFQGRIRLVVFGATNCAANPLANPMLNRLNQLYGAKGVEILNIYTSETIEQANHYISGNGISFPVYLSDRTLSKAYCTLGTPNFYLVDRNNRIALAENGYSDRLETSLIKQIDALLME